MAKHNFQLQLQLQLRQRPLQPTKRVTPSGEIREMATTVKMHKGKKPSPTTFRAQAQKIRESTKISVKRGSSGLSKKMDAISISNSARTSVKRASGEKLTNNSMRMQFQEKWNSNSKLIYKSWKGCNGSPKNLKFRRGKIIDFQSEKLSPRRLKFRPAKTLENNGNEISHVRGRSSRRLIAYGKSNSAKDETMKVNLRHQSRGDKKEAPILFNNVIEETATKLEETRRSKVKALVGAFETGREAVSTDPRLDISNVSSASKGIGTELYPDEHNYIKIHRRNREPPQSTLFSLVYNSPNNEDDLPFAIIHKPKATSKPKYFVTPTPPVRIHQTRKHTAELKIAAESSKVVRSSETKEENMIEEFEVPTEIEDDSEQEEFVPTHPKVRRSNQNLKKFLAIVAPKNKRKQDVSLRNIGIKHAIDMNERINLSALMIKHMNRIISLGIDPHDLAYEFLLTIVLENFRVKLKNGKIATESDIINVKTLIEYDCLTTNLITQLMFDLEVAQAKNARLKDETTRLQNRVATSQAEVVQLREVVQLKNDMLMQQNAHLAAFDAMMVQLKDDILTQ
ncbi:hypothetical protein T459_10383 [Capsicum annuum]|uniref:Calmodulin-binding domain-containing protein n=1 Tax=Capsicum annuum TaxID=4072 RepID=A0A2G3A219_CAPAN|nr:hypothetical protein T459_10383 [Capsicum annuum]